MNAAEYKHLVLGLIFTPCIGDSLAAHKTKLIQRLIRQKLGGWV